MRRTSLGVALALLIVGCGLDGGSTAPEEPEIGLPDPVVTLPDLEPAAATAATNFWTTKASMPTPRTSHAVGVVNGVIYAVGGTRDGNTLLATVQAYNPGTNTWVTRAPMPSARAFLNGTGTINGILYVAGGGTRAGRSTPCSRTTRRPIPGPRKRRCCRSARAALPAVIGGKLYVYSTCTKMTATLQRYDPATNSWKLMKGPTSLHETPVAGVINGKLYLAGGGHDGIASGVMEVYDPATNTWTPRPADAHPALERHGSRDRRPVLRPGRFGGYTPAPTTEVYDPGSGTWQVKPSIPTPRIGLAGAAVNGKIYAIGGGFGSGTLGTNEVYTPGDVWVTRSAMPAAARASPRPW